jgi:hypothetical protein
LVLFLKKYKKKSDKGKEKKKKKKTLLSQRAGPSQPAAYLPPARRSRPSTAAHPQPNSRSRRLSH